MIGSELLLSESDGVGRLFGIAELSDDSLGTSLGKPSIICWEIQTFSIGHKSIIQLKGYLCTFYKCFKNPYSSFLFQTRT